ncbi:hypothetical protein N0V93_004733 [Gnomoniopsis smithogilvyi]|uniref:Uncharacterized protein n=1 Tax=Gnomoniopsis smithogilvyi TaxID=1191159 RepID=A0A9W8YTD9_9PEZI|nr:hypothetical protein N0V93_004733 [Gnomoniopsis smithogilvyi]
MSATRTILGPLLTTFTPPSTCTEVMLDLTADSSEGWLAQSCSSDVMNDDASCWPSATSGVTTSTNLWGFGIYSPGTVCPTGYVTACSATSGVEGGFDFQFPLESRSGIVSGITSTVVQTCTSSATGGSFIAATCDGDGSFVSTHTVSTDLWIHAPLMQLAWQASDISATAISTSILTSTITRGSTSSSTAVPTSSTSSSASQSSSGLSRGALAGIGVAAAVLVLSVVFSAICLFRKRRRTRQNARVAEMVSDSQAGGFLGGGSSYDTSHGHLYELGDPKFAGSHSRPYELGDPNTMAHELSDQAVMEQQWE